MKRANSRFHRAESKRISLNVNVWQIKYLILSY